MSLIRVKMVRLYHFALVVRRLLVENRSFLYQFHRFKKPAVASQLHKPHIYLAFLGFSFAKKEEVEVKSIEFTMVDQTSLEKADQLFDDNKFQETVDFLKTLDQSSADVQWRLGRALFKCSGMDANSSKKNELIRDAYKNVHEALQKDDNNFAIHKWYAILLDANSNLDGIKARVQELENVKKHMVRAIELNPEDPTSRYILGEFAFGLADLPWYQRKIVSTIFATPPTATYEEALEHFLKAEDLKADFYSMNKLMIGKCYIAIKDNEKAREYLTKASSITVQNEDDRKCKEEATKLLSKVK